MRKALADLDAQIAKPAGPRRSDSTWHAQQGLNEHSRQSHRLLLARVGLSPRAVPVRDADVRIRRREVRAPHGRLDRCRRRREHRGRRIADQPARTARGTCCATIRTPARPSPNWWATRWAPGSFPRRRPATAALDKIIDGEWPYFAENCDPGGQLDFYGMQALIVRTTAESGDGIVRFRQRLAEDNFRVPLQLQVLEGDYLDIARTMSVANGHIIQGVQFNLIGQREYLLALQLPSGRGLHAEPARRHSEPAGTRLRGDASRTASCGPARCAACRGWRR